MKFNLSTNAVEETTNYMGATAYKLSPEMELYTAVATCMVDDSYYEKQEERLNRIRQLIAQCAPEFVAKLAIYTRKEMNLRSIPVVLAVELAKAASGNNLVSKTINGIVQRADAIKEILAYYQFSNKRAGVKKLNKLSKQVQKGLATAFNKFDEYQFAKYNTAAEIKMRDALFLVHPKAKDEAQQALFNKIVKDELETPYTWETVLSELGKKPFATEAEKQHAIAIQWEELVMSGKLGYMAVLRNLRNILTKGSAKAFAEALKILTDANKVKKAKQLPFRYLSAFTEIEKLSTAEIVFEDQAERIKQATAALEKALLIACDNICINEGKTAILSDNSGSMYGDAAGKSLVSAMSSRKTADIANLFAVLYWNKSNNTSIGLFGDHLIQPVLNRNSNLFENFKLINAEAKKCGPSTERGIFEYMDKLISSKTIVDRIIIFSDCQVGTGCNWFDSKGNRGDNFNKLLTQYLAINPAVKVYSVDLKGYGNSLTKAENKNTVLVSGWSEKIFDMIYYIENGSTVVDQINHIEL
jgi:60 kDa SS-A/Ro ribonucleoprotein